MQRAEGVQGARLVPGPFCSCAFSCLCRAAQPLHRSLLSCKALHAVRCCCDLQGFVGVGGGTACHNGCCWPDPACSLAAQPHDVVRLLVGSVCSMSSQTVFAVCLVHVQAVFCVAAPQSVCFSSVALFHADAVYRLPCCMCAVSQQSPCHQILPGPGCVHASGRRAPCWCADVCAVLLATTRAHTWREGGISTGSGTVRAGAPGTGWLGFPLWTFGL